MKLVQPFLKKLSNDQCQGTIDVLGQIKTVAQEPQTEASFVLIRTIYIAQQ